MARVLITGVAGFIGSTLARALVREGASVCGLDDLSSGKMENIEDLLPELDFVHASVLDREALDRCCRGVDFVFHEAAIPSVPKSVLDPVGTNGPNLDGTLLVLEASRRAGVKRLMNAASSAVYGDSPILPKHEGMLPEPISPYAVQKLASEHYLRSYARVYGLETVSLRYFNIFGPRQDPTSQYSGVLARFISQMLDGETPTIFGDGSTSRDFTFVENVVHANLLAAKAPSRVSGQVFNVATGTRVTLLQAFRAIQDITGYEGQPRFLPERDGDIRHSGASIDRSREDLSYEVVVGFAEGLERTIDWYRDQRTTPATVREEQQSGTASVDAGRVLQSA